MGILEKIKCSRLSKNFVTVLYLISCRENILRNDHNIYITNRKPLCSILDEGEKTRKTHPTCKEHYAYYLTERHKGKSSPLLNIIEKM